MDPSAGTVSMETTSSPIGNISEQQTRRLDCSLLSLLGSPIRSRYNTVRQATVPVTYSFSRLSSNSMLLVPPPDSPDSRPVYYISVDLNCFNPLSSITSVYSGVTEHGELVAEFESGITTKACNIYISGTEAPYEERLKAIGEAIWPPIWTNEDHKFAWNCRVMPWTCHPLNNSRETYAQYRPALKMCRRNGLSELYTLEIMPGAHDKFDDLLVSSLLIEQQRLSPAEGETKRTDTRKLFNFRAWQLSGH